MNEYKVARREDPQGASKFLKKAEKLKDVSKKARVAAASL